MQQLQVRENVVGFEKALGAVKVTKDQIQYRSQSLLNLAHGYFIPSYVLLHHSVNTLETYDHFQVTLADLFQVSHWRY